MRKSVLLRISALMLLWVASGTMSAQAQEPRQSAKIIEEAKKERELSIYGSFTGGLQATPEGRVSVSTFGRPDVTKA